MTRDDRIGGADDQDVPEGTGMQKVCRGDGYGRHVSILFVDVGSDAERVAAVDSMAISAAGEEALTDAACRAIPQHSWCVTGAHRERNLV
jgi:hypothetical protein